MPTLSMFLSFFILPILCYFIFSNYKRETLNELSILGFINWFHFHFHFVAINLGKLKTVPVHGHKKVPTGCSIIMVLSLNKNAVILGGVFVNRQFLCR